LLLDVGGNSQHQFVARSFGLASAAKVNEHMPIKLFIMKSQQKAVAETNLVDAQC
jgi:hypothetical protein